MHANPVVDHWLQKENANWIWITVGGNLINFNEELLVPMVDFVTEKLHWNSFMSTVLAKYKCINIFFYLMAKLVYFEYMTTPLALFSQWIIEQYDHLNWNALNGKVNLELGCAVRDLPQAGIMANKRLQRKLAPFRYHECLSSPGLWYCDTCPILFILMVDNFSVKYINDDDVKHLIASLKMTYKYTEDWTGDLYCSIALDWDYINRTVDISMPGIMKKKIQEYGHLIPNRMQKCPYSPEPKKMVPKHNPPSHPMIHQNWTQRVLNMSNKLWAAFCTMHKLWTWRS